MSYPKRKFIFEETSSIVIEKANFIGFTNGAVNAKNYTYFKVVNSLFRNCSSNSDGACIKISPNTNAMTIIFYVCTLNTLVNGKDTKGQSICLLDQKHDHQEKISYFTAAVGNKGVDCVVLIGGNLAMHDLNLTQLNIGEFGAFYIGSCKSEECKVSFFTLSNCSCNLDLIRYGDINESISSIQYANIVKSKCGSAIVANVAGIGYLFDAVISQNTAPAVARHFAGNNRPIGSFLLGEIFSDIRLISTLIPQPSSPVYCERSCIDSYTGNTQRLKTIDNCGGITYPPHRPKPFLFCLQNLIVLEKIAPKWQQLRSGFPSKNGGFKFDFLDQ